MSAHGHTEDDQIAGINVTPLVDIALVLLIIFMVTAKFIMPSALPMTPPRAERGVAVQSPLSIELYAGGEVRMGDQRVESDEAVIRLAQEAKAHDPEVRAILRADTSVPHGRVIRAIDLLRTAGIERIAFAVAPDAAPKESLIPKPAP